MSAAHNIMPTIDLSSLSSKLSKDELDIVKKIIWAKRLRSNPPKVSFHKERYIRINNQEESQAAYLWALCAYFVSPYKIHGACRPNSKGIENFERLEEISDLICKSVPQAQWYGLITRGER